VLVPGFARPTIMDFDVAGIVGGTRVDAEEEGGGKSFNRALLLARAEGLANLD
jgi:hypothetical protein